MESFLSVNGVKLSLSCNDLRSEEPEKHDESDIKQLRKHSFGWASLDRSSMARFLRPKSAGHGLSAAASLDRRAKSRPKNRPKSSGEFVDNIDFMLADIKERLAMFRKQDAEFHERIESLSTTIDEIASRSSISLTPSDISIASDVMLSDDDDGDYEYYDDDHEEEENYEDDRVILNEIEGVSSSFSREILNSIPTIEVTYHKRRLSDTTIHEPLCHKSSAGSERHSICVPNYAYLYSNTGQMHEHSHLDTYS